MKTLLKKILTLFLAFAFTFGMLSFALPERTALADGRPAFTITGADEPLLNGLYAAGGDVNGKAAYLGPDGHAALSWSAAGNRWELNYDGANKYYSLSIAGDPLPPTDGWLKADGTADADFALQYGPAFSFQSIAVTVDETAGVAELTVIPTDFPLPSAVDYAAQNGTALSGGDYTASGGTLHFAGGTAPATVQIPIESDTTYESDETFTVVLSNPSAGARILNGTCTVTIHDDDPAPTIEFNPFAVTAGEADASANLTVKLSNPSAFDVSVGYATSDGTAKDGSDYTAKSDTLTVSAGQTSGTIAVALNDDGIYEGSETFAVALSGPSGAALGAAASATVTIADDEAAPIIGFHDAAASAAEASGSITLAVDLSAASAVETTVQYATAGGTAEAGQDYTEKSGTVTISAGETSGTIEIALAGDALHETGETFTVALTGPVNATLGTAAVTVTITDDDPMPSMGFSSTSVNVNETAASAVFTVSLSAVSGMDTAVQYATSNGTAAAGQDYTGKTGTATIPAGSTSTTITVPLLADSIYEGYEDFRITLSSPSGAALDVAQATAVIADATAIPTVSFDPATPTVHEDGGTATLAVKLSGASSHDVTVKYATADGSAKAGADYTAKSGTLTFPAGSTAANIQIPLLDDTLREGNEQFTVSLSEPSGALLGAWRATVTVADDEPALTVGFSAAAKSIHEADGEIALTVKLSGVSISAVAVHYTTKDGSAAEDEDYLAEDGVLSIPAGSTSKTVYIEIYDDADHEGSETFTVQLSGPSGADLGASKVKVTILDDDPAPTPVPTATPTPAATPIPSPSPTPSATAAPTATPSPAPSPAEGGGSVVTVPQEELRNAAGTGNGLAVEIRNVRFIVPPAVLRQLPGDAQAITLECVESAGTAPSFTITGFDGKQLAPPLSFSLTVTGADGTAEPLSQFGEPLTISVRLTQEQAQKIVNPQNVKMCRYDPQTGEAEALDSQYDPDTRTLTFTTPHFSEFVPMELSPASRGLAWYWWTLIIAVCLGFAVGAIEFVHRRYKRD